MNVKGLRSAFGGKIGVYMVTRKLKNRRYIGEFKYCDIIHPHGIPAIIPDELFDRVQRRMAANKKAPAKHKAEDEYLLTTKLRCANVNALWLVKVERANLDGISLLQMCWC